MGNVIAPQSAFGNRAANSLMPNMCIENACIHKNKGAFPKMVDSRYEFLDNLR